VRLWPACIDYSFARPPTRLITAAHYQGALRYLGQDGRCLDAAERDYLLGAGLSIGLIWETSARRPLKGKQAGINDAQDANREADEVGAPPNIPIFYAVDFEPTPAELNGPVRAYFEGAMSVTGRPVRAYGCAAVVHQMCQVWRWWESTWQCAAWSRPGSIPADAGSPIIEGGYRLVQSHHACMLQTIGYVLAETSDHNNILTEPWWWWGQGNTEEIEDDEMPTMDEIRREFTGQSELPSHQVLSKWEADSRRFHVFICRDIRPSQDQWWGLFGLFKLRLPAEYVDFWRARPDVVYLGDQDGGSWPIAVVDMAAEVVDSDR
jgi:hypothetical protein